jgi:hypothetical protein
VFGEEHIEVANSMNDLATLLCSKWECDGEYEEEYKEAEALYHKSIRIKHKVCVVYFITLPYYHRLSIGIGRE